MDKRTEQTMQPRLPDIDAFAVALLRFRRFLEKMAQG